MAEPTVIVAPRLFDGETWHEDGALILQDGRIDALISARAVPDDIEPIMLESGFLAPGFVDLQVNGGGGVLFNDAPTLETIRAITHAHACCGTTAVLATLISDTPQVTAKAVLAAAKAHRENVPGFLGLHLEGPHLAASRKGAHAEAVLRPIDTGDLALYSEAVRAVGVLMITLAPEVVDGQTISSLAESGIVVSLGHTDTTFAGASASFAAGATLVTHLFNAMSPLGHREPGMVGAALRTGGAWVGLIADGHHVAPEAIAVALAAKAPPGRLFLVSDAMATIGSDIDSFTLNGRIIHRRDGRLKLDDGTLAGADIDMAAALRFMHYKVGMDLDESLRMASLYPAMAVRRDSDIGRLEPGHRGDLVHLDEELNVRGTWIGGRAVGDAGGDG